MAPAMDTRSDKYAAGGNDPRADRPAGKLDLVHALEEHERTMILKALQESRGNKAKAARALGITERLMGIRVKRLGIDWRSLRPRYTGERAPA